MDKEAKTEIAFPIWKLPYPPLRKVIGFLMTLEIFQLSLTSSASRNRMKQFRFQCLNEGCIKMNNATPFAERSVRIYPEERIYRGFGFLEIYPSAAPKHERGKRSIEIINGVKMTLISDPGRESVGNLYAEGGTENYISAMKFFVDTFGCIFELLYIKLGDPELPQYKSEIAIADEWRDVTLSQYDLAVPPKPVSNEEIYEFCENLKVTKFLTLSMNFQPNFELPPVLTTYIETIDVQGDWWNGEKLYRLNCQNIRLTRTTLTAEELLKFVTNWYYSDNKVFKDFWLIWNKIEIAPLDLTAFNPTKFKIENRKSESEKYWTCIESEFGYDIKRKDGMIGSICHEGNRFHFVVWHNKFTDNESETENVGSL